MSSFNLPATLSAFKLITSPSSLLPHARVPTFSLLPSPITSLLPPSADIQAVVLDKDNCFASKDASCVHESNITAFKELRKQFPGNKLLIVSNTAGTAALDPNDKLALAVEAATDGVPVLRHVGRKPDQSCIADIMAFFRAHPETNVSRPAQVVVVGDRLLTDIVMANNMGAWSIWIHDGVLKGSSWPVRLERFWLAYVESFYNPIYPK
ncbi:mitochondrial PGP phosphatase [Lipomyces oligophaga]|uniref:mitochondrial PGP phosphatase n=1 Tax=Lipomyces oligophaga TaxID=45792 RepID=UPI0034D01087